VTGFDFTIGCPGFDDPTPNGGAIILKAASGTGTVTFASPQTVLLSWSDGGGATADGVAVAPGVGFVESLGGFVSTFFDVARSIYTVVGPAFLGLSVASLGVVLVLRWTRSIRSTV
jgi:hypothetical protein